METKTIRPKIHTQSILLHLCEESGNPGLCLGAEMIMRMLERVASRAIELEDEVLLKEMEQFCLVEKAKG